MFAKRIFVSFISVLMVVTLFVSCTGVVDPDKITVKTGCAKQADFSVFKNAKHSEPFADTDFINSVNSFAFSTGSKVLNVDSSENLAYSPYSFYNALAIARLGANGKTLDQINNVINPNNFEESTFNSKNAQLFKNVFEEYENSKINIYNSLWLQNNFEFNEDYLNAACNDYFTTLFNADFASKKTASDMSKWIENNTKGLIKPNFETKQDQIMAIINTIYLKKSWADEFSDRAVREDLFYLNNSSQDNAKCEFMQTYMPDNGYVKGEDFIGSSLYFKDGGGMRFILPDSGVKINDLIKKPETLSKMFAMPKQSADITFKIPKFDVSSKIDLVETSKQLGIKDAFDMNNADLSKISKYKITKNNNIFIGSINQEAKLKIDEKGVEGAAFTKIDVMTKSSMLPKALEKIEITLNRPFIYGVFDKNNVLIFIGLINNPTLN